MQTFVDVLFCIIILAVVDLLLLAGLGVAKLVRWLRDRYWWVRWFSL